MDKSHILSVLHHFLLCLCHLRLHPKPGQIFILWTNWAQIHMYSTQIQTIKWANTSILFLFLYVYSCPLNKNACYNVLTFCIYPSEKGSKTSQSDLTPCDRYLITLHFTWTRHIRSLVINNSLFIINIISHVNWFFVLYWKENSYLNVFHIKQ